MTGPLGSEHKIKRNHFSKSFAAGGGGGCPGNFVSCLVMKKFDFGKENLKFLMDLFTNNGVMLYHKFRNKLHSFLTQILVSF